MQARRTVKGGVIADFGGRNKEDGILLEAHCDTLGGMVAQIKENGRLKLTNIGGMKPANAEAENVRIITKADGIYEGTCQLVDASVHVNGSYEKTERTWDTVEVLVDEDVTCREDAVKLGIMPGDYVCFVPEGVTEAWSVDMGCVGEGLQCTEREVSICAKDSGGPYNYDILCRLVELAKEHGIGYAVDVYPHYGSDVETTLKSGHDVRHALIGPGVYASHGYERSHRDGAENTFRLIQAYIG